ncbi:MAG: lactonase family protein [Chloroflexi bacterium]|nr:lactonase family protein [Chloroflexota bacterium]
MTPQRVIIGTYTHQEGSAREKGLYALALDPATGQLECESVFGEIVNPSYLALSKSNDVLYAVCELGEFGGVPGGGLSALRLSGHPRNATLINAQPTHDSWPCHVTISPSGKWALVANYGGGLTVFPIRPDGSLGEAVCNLRQQGRGTDPERQDGPHAHSIVFDPSGRFALACDLGLDRVFIFRLDETTGQLIANEPAWMMTEPGAGPRHTAFHPGGRWLYVVNELSSTVTACAFDAERGALTPVQTVSALPAGFKDWASGAAVRVAPSGRFLYTSNRGHDSIAVFAIDAETGGLTRLTVTPAGGKTPRDFAIDPTGRCLIVAHQNSDSLATFLIDPGDRDAHPHRRACRGAPAGGGAV